MTRSYMALSGDVFVWGFTSPLTGVVVKCGCLAQVMLADD